MFGDIAEHGHLAAMAVPTLVLYSPYEQRFAAETGRDIAAGIRGAAFLGLENGGHRLPGLEPASQVFVETVREVLARR